MGLGTPSIILVTSPASLHDPSHSQTSGRPLPPAAPSPPAVPREPLRDPRDPREPPRARAGPAGGAGESGGGAGRGRGAPGAAEEAQGQPPIWPLWPRPCSPAGLSCSRGAGGAQPGPAAAAPPGGGALLVPYDGDSNHAPCSRRGHRAHWALLIGLLVAVPPQAPLGPRFQRDPEIPNVFHAREFGAGGSQNGAGGSQLGFLGSLLEEGPQFGEGSQCQERLRDLGQGSCFGSGAPKLSLGVPNLGLGVPNLGLGAPNWRKGCEI
ncbi:actin maturation protease [Molothrus aeneus]|uniref:actin maturation protease n=1 Tax=Molothrus aeneus TaxID=84833 RepID=UPI0034594937